jgi:hypothetical protein
MTKVKEDSYQKTIIDPLIEPYFIGMDSYCYTVYENVIAESSGKVYIKTMGHYSNLNLCLEKIARSIINSKNYSSIKEYINEFNQVNNQLKQISHI